MKLEYKYILCYSEEKSKQLSDNGYAFLYEQHGTFYHLNNSSVSFSNKNLLDDTKLSFGLNF